MPPFLMSMLFYGVAVLKKVKNSSTIYTNNAQFSVYTNRANSTDYFEHTHIRR